MLVLPRGITGFWSCNDTVTPPNTSKKEFSAICHAVAQHFGGKVVPENSEFSRIPKNFNSATLLLPEHTISAVLNAHYPFLALAFPIDRSAFYPNFLDSLIIAEYFRKIGYYTVLTKSDLDALITDDVTAELAKAELTQVKYWKPKTIGELMFNCWD